MEYLVLVETETKETIIIVGGSKIGGSEMVRSLVSELHSKHGDR